MERRMFVTFAAILILFSVVCCNLALLSANEIYADASDNQTSFRIQIDNGRGNFLDCHFEKLTGCAQESYVLLEPTVQTYYDAFDMISVEDRQALYTGIQKSKPFLLPVQNVSLLPQDALVFPQVQRYLPMPTACHLIGYCNGENVGVSGLEAAAQELLQGGSTAHYVVGGISAQGNFLSQDMPHLELSTGSGNALALTLDATLQRVCEGIAAENMDQGAIVVLETRTGKVRASVSMPVFDPNNVGESIESGNTALLNRAISAYSVGSVFKPLLAAAALEHGFDPQELYECTGSIEVDGHIYRCAHGRGHGEVDLAGALAQSCNCYFIKLGLAMGGDAILDYANKTGFSQSTQIYGTLRTAAGNLPDAQTLKNTGQLSGISFGQGELLASPLQIAAFMNVFANKGVYVSPSFVEGVANEYTRTVTQSLYAPLQRQAIRPKTAETVREMLVQVVEDGLGKSAKPTNGTAGGKTGTAQTGRYNKDGEEIMDAWFAGFYPAENPQYTVAVLLDSGTHSGEDACKIFSQVTSALHYFCTSDATDFAS